MMIIHHINGMMTRAVKEQPMTVILMMIMTVLGLNMTKMIIMSMSVVM